MQSCRHLIDYTLAMHAASVEAAAENNACWCDALCRAHGLYGAFMADAWILRDSPPPFYPNMVTLRAASATAHARLIEEIIAADPQRAFGFKDSFASVSTTGLSATRRFEVVFEATWIARAPTTAAPRGTTLHWSRVETETELETWEQTWHGDAANRTAAPPPRQFPRALLANRQIAFLAGRGPQGCIDAVAIANRTGAVIGLSNVFGPAAEPTDLWLGAAAAAWEHFTPAPPLVGYARGDALHHALQAGFEPLGKLRVLMLA